MSVYIPSLGYLYSFGMILMAFLVMIKRNDMLAIRYFVFSFFAFAWGVTFFFLLDGKLSESNSVVLGRIVNGLAAPIPATWLHFTLEFSGQKKGRKHLLLVAYAISALLVLLSPTALFVNGVHAYWDFRYYPSPGPFYLLFAVHFTCFVFYSFCLLFLNYLRSSGTQKTQMRFFLIGTTLAFAGGSITFLPIYSLPAPMFLIALMPLYPFFMGVGLLRYGLFDPQSIASAFQKEKLATIGILTTSMNHEVRNPLYVIQGLAEAYLRRVEEKCPMDADYPKETLNKIIAQAHRASGTIKRFASFAKQRVDQDLHFGPVSIGRVLDEVMLLVGSELAMEKVSVVREVPDDLPPVRADRRLMEEILFNLIVNACQAMTTAGGRIVIRARGGHEPAPPSFPPPAGRGEAGGGIVRIEISDTGPGMPAEQLRNIFQPFYTTREQGTGLGLYITKLLVEKNRGRIAVESKPGEGTKFVLEFNR